MVISLQLGYITEDNCVKIHTVSVFTCEVHTGCLQMSGAVSKVNKKFISHLTRANLTPSAATTVQVPHALPAVRSLVLVQREFRAL